jgi:hypothetical protein
MKSSLFYDVTQLTLVIIYRRFGTASLSHLQESSRPTDLFLKKEQIECLETSVTNLHCTRLTSQKSEYFS